MRINATSGNTIEFDVDVFNSEDEAVVLTGSQIDFTASTIDGEFTIHKTELSGIEISGDVPGRMTVTIDSDDTSDLTAPRNFLWDIELTDPFGFVRTVAKGMIALSLPVSAL